MDPFRFYVDVAVLFQYGIS